LRNLRRSAIGETPACRTPELLGVGCDSRLVLRVRRPGRRRPKHVLVLFSYTVCSPLRIILSRKIRATLDTLPDGVEFYSEALDNAASGTREGRRVRELMRAKYGRSGSIWWWFVGPTRSRS